MISTIRLYLGNCDTLVTMCSTASRRSGRLTWAIIWLMVAQAVMPWSWVHAQMMPADLVPDVPPCHAAAMASHGEVSSDDDHKVPGSTDQRQQAESVCERACALSQTTLPSAVSSIKGRTPVEPIEFIASRYLSYTPKVPTPPPNA